MLAAGVLGRMTTGVSVHKDGDDDKRTDVTSLAQQVKISLVCLFPSLFTCFLQLTCFFPRDSSHDVQSATMKNKALGYT